MVRAVVLCALAFSAGCHDRTPPGKARSSSPTDDAPADVVSSDTTRDLEGGIRVREVTLVRHGVPMTIWIYRAAEGPERRPVVMIAAAGSPLFTGMSLGDSDRPEHVPWASRGYVVVAYSLAGPLPDNATDLEVKASARAFLLAHAGLDNAQAALDFVLAHERGVDPDRVYSVGHSSAATISLRFGAEDTRVKAVVAFNGITDVPRRVNDAMPYIVGVVPDARSVLAASSPMSHVAQLRTKPVFLFHSEEDGNVPADESRDLAKAMDPAHASSRLEIVPHGDHYSSMLEQGVPLAIDWLDGIDGGGD